MAPNPFVTAYISCMLWSSTDESTPEGGEPLDENYTDSDLAPEAMEKVRNDCNSFYDRAGALLDEWDDEQAGHDYWLTRNGHGAGFWDRGKDAGAALTELAHADGTCDAYVGDDGKIYLS